jgi:hypothetical protein
MDDEIRRLRAEAQRLAQGKSRSQVRYPRAFRRAAVALARMRVRQGGSVARLAQDVGVSVPTLTKWLGPTTVPMLRPVALTPAPTPEGGVVGSAVLITPHGVRVEGLDRDTLVAVLHALG